MRVETAVSTAGPDFGARVRQALAPPRARYLYLTTVPGPYGEEPRVVAWCDTASPTAAVAAPLTEAPTRPSGEGVRAALGDEERLAAAGLAWGSPPARAAVTGRGLMTFPLGPVRADVAECAGWRLQVMGDEVLGLDLRFGYKPRHLEAALSAAGPEAGLAIAERVTGTSPFAHGLCYCLAWEEAMGLRVPRRATALRGLLAELERLYSHIGDLAALAAATGLPAAAAELFILKEDLLRLCAHVTGHRYQRGLLALGGLATDPGAALGALPAALDRLQRRFRANLTQLDASTSHLDRLHTAGIVTAAAAAELHPVGPVGRACGLPYDVRSDEPYGPYGPEWGGAPAPALRGEGDAWARYRLRVMEVLASLAWLRARLPEVPDGPVLAAAPAGPGALGVFLARVEAPRGELLYLVCPPGRDTPGWVRLRTPSAVNWAVVPGAVAQGNVLQDVPIIDASFALSVAAVDR